MAAGLIRDAVLAAQDGQRLRISAGRADVYQRPIGILRLDAQQHHIVAGEADVFRTANGRHRQGVRLVRRNEPQTLLSDAVDVGRTTNQQRVVSGAVKVSADTTADCACAKDHKPHRVVSGQWSVASGQGSGERASESIRRC
jgi:hypothetical protein